MSSARLSRWSRGFVAAGVCFLVAWQVAAVGGFPRRTSVALGLYGFVLHVVFGKAYSLVPSYFDRDLASSLAPAVHLPLSMTGAVGLALAPLVGVTDVGTTGAISSVAGTAGAVLWTAGVAVFLGTLAVTLRGNLFGRETGTGEHNADRRPVDRAANLFVPVVLAYLAAGTWETLAVATGLPTLLGGYPPRTTHLLAAGTAALLVFAIGFRLLPRFMVAEVPPAAPWLVLPAGAVGPAIVAATLPAGPGFRLGALVEAVAVVGFAATYLLLWVRTDRDRVGFYGPLAGVAAGALAAGLGLSFAFGAPVRALVTTHYRLNLLGFLGLTIVGVTYQFYPPGVGRFPAAGDRLALGTMGAIALGLAVELVAAVVTTGGLELAGRIIALAGTVAYAYLVLGVFLQRARG